jgi:hypothetical protein
MPESVTCIAQGAFGDSSTIASAYAHGCWQGQFACIVSVYLLQHARGINMPWKAPTVQIDISDACLLARVIHVTTAQAIHSNVNVDAAWRAFAGPGTGAFARAKWHANPAGIVSMADGRSGAREPESPNLQAWRRTYKDLLKTKDKECRKDLLVLLSDYLVAVPGSPTVERWLGEIKFLELKHRAHKLAVSSVAAALRLLKCDLRGRRPPGTILDPTELLCKATHGVTHGGANVVFPASGFMLSSQRIYREFHGERVLPGRDLIPVSVSEQVAGRHRASKPCIGRIQKLSSTSVAVRMREHSAGLKAGAAAFHAGVREGVLGEVAPPTAAAPSHLSQMVAAVKVASALRSASSSGSVKKRERDAVDEDSPTGPVAKQARILETKRHAHIDAPPGQMPDYVGPRGEQWLATVPTAKLPEGNLPKLQEHPKVFFGDGIPEVLKRECLGNVNGTLCKKSRHADVVIVDSIAGRWESVDAMSARLWGRSLADTQWALSKMKKGSRLAFRSVLQENLRVFMSDGFAAEWPQHAKLLRHASLTASEAKKAKCFVLVCGMKPEGDKSSVSLLSTSEVDALPVHKGNKEFGLRALLQRITFAA